MGGKTQNALVTISVFGLLIMLMVSAAAITLKLVWIDGALTNAGTELVFTEVVVQSGDTLWAIAANQMPDEDPRDAVARIRELNQLQSAEIFPGQVLTLEVKRSVQAGQLASRP